MCSKRLLSAWQCTGGVSIQEYKQPHLFFHEIYFDMGKMNIRKIRRNVKSL